MSSQLDPTAEIDAVKETILKRVLILLTQLNLKHMYQNPNIAKYLNRGGYHDRNISENIRASYKETHVNKEKTVKKEFADNRMKLESMEPEEIKETD